MIIQGPLNNGITVIGNALRDNDESGVIVFDRPKNVQIVGNQIANNGHYGVYLYRTFGAVVSSNNIKNNSQAANGGYHEVFLDGDATQNSLWNIVSGNKFETSGAHRAAYVIKEASIADGPNMIFGNLVPDAGIAGRIGVLHDSSPQSSMSMCKNNYGRIDYNRGVAQFNGTGAQTVFNIPHLLTPDEPRYVNATPASADARVASAAGFSVVKGPSNITVTFGVAPILSIGGVEINWEAST